MKVVTNKQNHLIKHGLAKVATYAIIALLGALSFSCSKHNSKSDQTISVTEDDSEMNAAIAKARDSLPTFWQIYEHHDHGESDFSLKVKITDKNGTEHFWVSDLERHDGKLSGVIDNDPNLVQSVKLGERITINEADISDWFYMRDGKMYGNATIRPLFKQMSAEESATYKKLLADPN